MNPLRKVYWWWADLPPFAQSVLVGCFYVLCIFALLVIPTYSP